MVRGAPDRLEQQVVEAEREVEGRVAEPGALGVEQDRARAARRRMFFGLTSPCTSARRVPAVRSTRRSQCRREIGVLARARLQVGFEPDRVESSRRSRTLAPGPHGRRSRRGSSRAGGRPVGRTPDRRGRREAAASRPGACRGQVGHREGERAFVVREHLGHRAGRDRGREAQVCHFVAAAFGRRAPVGAATFSCASARFTQTGPQASRARKMSDDTPPASGTSRTASPGAASPMRRSAAAMSPFPEGVSVFTSLPAASFLVRRRRAAGPSAPCTPSAAVRLSADRPRRASRAGGAR